MKYTVYAADGTILQYGFGNTLPEVDNINTFLLEGENPPDSTLYVVKDGKIVLRSDSDEVLKEREWVKIRTRRNKLLSASDYTQLGDSPRDKRAWAIYRQELRDLPQNMTDPFDVVWPQEP